MTHAQRATSLVMFYVTDASRGVEAACEAMRCLRDRAQPESAAKADLRYACDQLEEAQRAVRKAATRLGLE